MTKDILYHGSSIEIKGFLEPRPASDSSNVDNNSNGVYATNRFECAAGMSLVDEQKAFADYEEPNFKVVFLNEAPISSKKRFVYEISKRHFKETKVKHQFVSLTKVPILKTHVFNTEDLKQFWRMATKVEKGIYWWMKY